MGRPREGEGKRAAVAVASGAEQQRQKSMQEGAEEGRGGKAPPGSGWAGAALGRPAPLGLVALASLLLHAASLAQRVRPGLVPGSPPPRAPAFLAFPGGGG